MTASAAPFPIEETTIAALHTAYMDGRATAVSVCQSHLDRIAAYDRKGPALGAIIIHNPDALADAATLDAALESTGKLVGPLHGVPVLVKDNYDVAGLQTTNVRRFCGGCAAQPPYPYALRGASSAPRAHGSRGAAQANLVGQSTEPARRNVVAQAG